MTSGEGAADPENVEKTGIPILQSLMDTEDRWASLVQNAPDLIIIADPQGRIIYANHLLSSASPASILGKNLVDDYVEPEYREAVRAALGKVFAAGEPAEYGAIAAKGATGVTCWYSAKISPVKKEGRTVAALLIVRDVTELKSARDDLERFFNLAPEPLCIASPSGYFRKVNPAFSRILGYSKEEFLSRPFWEFIHPDDREPTRVEVENQLMGGTTLNFVNRYMTHEGESRYFAWKALQDPQTGLLYATAEDITESRRMQTALENANRDLKLFQNLVAHSQDSVLISDDEKGRYIWVNDATCQSLGYTREELLRMSFRDIDPNIAGDKESRAHIEKLRKTGSARFDSLNRRKDGSIFPVEVSVTMTEMEGRVYRVAIVRDITRRKRLEAELGGMKTGLERMVVERTADLVEANKALLEEQKARARSERGVKVGAARYRALIDAIMDGFLLMDQEGMILDVNEPYLKITGYSRDDLVGRNLSMVSVGMEAGEIPGYLIKLKERGSMRFETRHRKKDGKTVDVEISASHEPVEGGFVVETVRDITDRRMMQHAQRLEALSHLAGGMAHEFNNVLQGIMGAASLLEVRMPKGGQHTETVDQILAAARRGADVVRRMLTFSRRAEHEKKRLKVSDVFHEVVKLAASSMPATIHLRHNCATGDESVWADRTQLVQILINLMINGAHAMSDSGDLTLAAVQCRPGTADPHGNQDAGCRHCPFLARAAHRVCLMVGDAGHGIDPSIKERIFEPFFTTKEEGKGTGLGLTVALGIARENGGHMFFQSEPGGGTEFYVSFPSIPHAEVMEAESEPAFMGNGERILFVDDEKIITSMAKIYLESAGYVVEEFNDHKEAVSAFQAAPGAYNLVVTDQTMRGATGISVAARIKKIKPGIPIIMITGYQEKVSARAAKNSGIDRILYKPISPKDLATVIRQELDRGAGPQASC